ncbi:tyrosine-type recombinase/integrase [Actinomadura scrupuli]|uniref:tyrosine-type recombinase/integrase n=1 Tax=Actinomadura scrupuli TaxID=559629 RepID=UPI003D9826E8
MKGSTFKRCRCLHPETGKQYDTDCPKIKKNGHGSWWFRYEAPPSADGKRRRPRVGPFKTKEEAEAELVKELAKLGADGHASDRQITVGQWLDRWIANKLSLKDSTRGSYSETIELYLKPGLGHLRLVDLRDHHAEEFYNALLQLNRPLPAGRKQSEMLRRLIAVRADSVKKNIPEGEKRPKKSRKPLSPARVKRVHAVFSSALGTAVKKKYLTHNPIQHVELPRVPHRKPLVWTPERVARWRTTGKVPAPVMVWTPQQTGAFLDYAATERLYALFHLVAFRGLRRAEVAGLPWTDVDLKAGTIRIRETRTDADFDPDDPKSDYGDRTVTLDAMTVVALDAWRTAQDKERQEADAVWVDSGLVFTRQDGAPLNPAWISLRFDILLAQYAEIRHKHAEGWSVEHIARKHRTDQVRVEDVLNGVPLPPIRFHDLRHGAATLALAARVDMKVISETLGHARSAFTADTYTSILPELAKQAAEATAAVVPRRPGPLSAP